MFGIQALYIKVTLLKLHAQQISEWQNPKPTNCRFSLWNENWSQVLILICDLVLIRSVSCCCKVPVMEVGDVLTGWSCRCQWTADGNRWLWWNDVSQNCGSIWPRTELLEDLWWHELSTARWWRWCCQDATSWRSSVVATNTVDFLYSETATHEMHTEEQC